MGQNQTRKKEDRVVLAVLLIKTLWLACGKLATLVWLGNPSNPAQYLIDAIGVALIGLLAFWLIYVQKWEPITATAMAFLGENALVICIDSVLFSSMYFNMFRVENIVCVVIYVAAVILFAAKSSKTNPIAIGAVCFFTMLFISLLSGFLGAIRNHGSPYVYEWILLLSYLCFGVGFFLSGLKRNLLISIGAGLLLLGKIAILFSFFDIWGLIQVFAALVLVLVAAGSGIANQNVFLRKGSALWYLPAALEFLAIVGVVVFRERTFNLYALLLIGTNLANTAAHFLTGYFCIQPERLPRPKQVHPTPDGTPGSRAGARLNLGLHIFLMLIIGSLWIYIWIYRTTRWLNGVRGEPDRSPTAKLLLCLFVPFYSIYWTYKSAKRIDMLLWEAGIQSGIATTCLILSFLLPFVPPILIQSKLNTLSVIKAPIFEI